ncbi:hypothetical protein [Paraburkholderia bengalensis]|uniref:hypothetical protein n=1 Tax=Paraburkholderia bengalensis TaxID=2747562 RepID=UPI003014B110
MLLIAITALGTALAMLLSALGVDPVMALYWSAIVNGMTITPVLILLILLSAKREAIGDLAAHVSLRALCWVATLATGVALVAHYVLAIV